MHALTIFFLYKKVCKILPYSSAKVCKVHKLNTRVKVKAFAQRNTPLQAEVLFNFYYFNFCI